MDTGRNVPKEEKMLKNLFKKSEDGKDSKRQIENIIVFIIILIVTVLIINSMWSTDKKESEKDNENSSKVLAQMGTNASEKDELENKLEEILESINGVGKVKVLIKYSESSTVVPVYNETTSENTTQETDGKGVNKNVKETESKREIVYSDKDGKEQPITEKVIMPVIEGAIITAKGASNANVKSSIVSAVEAITGLAVHKIQVFEMGE